MFRRAWVPENSNLIMSCPLGSIPVHKSFSYQFFFLCKWPLQQMVNIYEKSPTWPLVSQILVNPVTASLFFSHPEGADWVCLSTSMNEVAGHNFPYFSCPTFSLPHRCTNSTCESSYFLAGVTNGECGLRGRFFMLTVNSHFLETSGSVFSKLYAK